MSGKFVRVGIAMLLFWLLFASVGAARAEGVRSIVWAGLYGEFELWRRPCSPLGAPVKLYGNLDIFEDRSTSLSPDGKLLRVGFGVYDLGRPGVRYPFRFCEDGRDEFPRGWTPESQSLLLGRDAAGGSDEYGGLYTVGLDGTRRLLVKPPYSGLDAVVLTRCSPDGSVLVVEGWEWLQVLETRTWKSLFFKRVDEVLDMNDFETRDMGESYVNEGSRIWLDGSRLLIPRNDSLLLLDVKERSVRPVLSKIRIRSIAYARGTGRLFASAERSGTEFVCSIDTGTWKWKRVDFPGLAEVEVFDATPDGKELLVAAVDKKGTDLLAKGLYLVDLATLRHTLAAKRAFFGLFVESGE